MGEIINLKAVRKKNARIEKNEQAEENRRRFGRTKAEKNFDRRAEEKTARFLQQNRLETSFQDTNSECNDKECGDNIRSNKAPPQ